MNYKDQYKLNDGTILSRQDIQELNANGPYSMAIWKSGEVSLGNEEGLAGRSSYLLNLIRSEITKNFTIDEIQNSTILDVGCNDGWILHNLSDLPFKKMVGIEPRQKNIDKGMTARRILKLSNKVSYKLGSIEKLDEEKFDIVICAGVLYHVESIPIALKNVKKACKKMLFIESRCISSKNLNEELCSEIEMRDIAYFFNEKVYGITAQKYESAYFDASSSIPTVVNVPSIETLIMHLNVLGFNSIKTVVDEKKYRDDVWKNRRPLSGVCLTALVNSEKKMIDEENNWIMQYESGYRQTILPPNYIELLYRTVCKKEICKLNDNNVKQTLNYIKKQKVEDFNESKCNPTEDNNKFVSEIVKNFIYSPYDKISFEYAKSLANQKRYDECIIVIKGIVEKLNSDWRCVYRSFCLLSKIYELMGDMDKSVFYKNLVLKSNSKYKF